MDDSFIHSLGASLVTLAFVAWDALPLSCSHVVVLACHQDTGKRFTPLNQLSTAATAKVDIVSSNLSELAVMGYEYGCVVALISFVRAFCG